jgi:hypothetical protein
VPIQRLLCLAKNQVWDVNTQRCVPRATNEEVAIWQGDCNGFLVVELRWLPRPVAGQPGPLSRPRSQVLTGDPGGPSTALVGLGALKPRLQAALRGVIPAQGRYALEESASKKPRTGRRSAKAKAKARTTRKKK